MTEPTASATSSPRRRIWQRRSWHESWKTPYVATLPRWRHAGTRHLYSQCWQPGAAQLSSIKHKPMTGGCFTQKLMIE